MSIAIALHVSIVNSTVVNPRDQHPANVRWMVQRVTCENQITEAKVKFEVHQHIFKEKKTTNSSLSKSFLAKTSDIIIQQLWMSSYSDFYILTNSLRNGLWSAEDHL